MKIVHHTPTEAASAELAERAARTSRAIEADHQRLIGAIRRLEQRGREPIVRREPRFLTDRTYWRRRHNELLRERLEARRCPRH